MHVLNIFFAEDHLKIDFIDGNYKLFSHGKSVRPCDVSSGERNIIALSYFFTAIMKEQAEKDVYSKEYLLVIDDPVSSFDTENRIGILSFLNYKLGAFLEGNINTKILIMTHDLMTFYDLHRVIDEIVKPCKKSYTLPASFKEFELCNGIIEKFKFKARQEYTELLERIYNYANDTSSDDEIVIGNMLRQTLEAFATFNYKRDIIHVSSDKEILALLKDPKYISYYKNLMYRLVLHGGSHREESVKALKDFRFFSIITEAEKREPQKIFCVLFIYLMKNIFLYIWKIVPMQRLILLNGARKLKV